MLREIALLGAGVALIASACSSGTSDATTYLAAVGEIENGYASSFTNITRATTESYATRGVLFGAVETSGFPEAAEEALRRAKATSPPAGLTKDHDNWIRYRSTIENISEVEFDQALEDQDLQELVGILTTVEQDYGSFLTNVGREFCLAATIDGDLCQAGDDLPGGEYGQRVHEILRLNRLRLFGLFTFPPVMTTEERSTRLGDVQPRIESSLKSAGDAMAQIDPPDAFTQEHDAFIRYFQEQYETAAAITKANAEGDDSSVLALFEQSGDVADRLNRGLSPDYAPIAAPFFAGDFTNRSSG
jgi:hypothetical protein